ncbi:MAG: 50S ribosomal protein L13 [Candidatus Omnitrophica bacterium]|nr:50S ribosomal protein L13 [Candidatus Omnitrophota bacterium]
MKKTFFPKKENIQRDWFLVNAEGKILGRIASKIAKILMGKHKTIYSPHIDTGDAVIVINAGKIKVTGKKLKDKIYRKYSGYPGGLKELSLEEMLKKNPKTVIRLAVKRMLPQSPLGRKMLRKLKVYTDDKHPHQAQKPQVIEV